MDQKERVFFSIDEAAQYLGLTVSYTYKLVHFGKLAHYKPNQGRLYFTREDLDSFILRNRRSADFELGDRADKILNTPHRSRSRHAEGATV